MNKIVTFIIVILFFSSSFTALAQFPVSLNLKSDGSTVSSPTTQLNKRYRITVDGTYSMWPQFPDCHGVDAAYVWDVPQEEIDKFSWPPVILVPLPHWVGDNTVWAFPPFGTPLFELSFRKYKGFRIDNEPLPNSGFNMLNHRYQTEKMGTGLPFDFQLLDSNYDIKQKLVIPRYEDNCGSLRVIVEAVPETDLNICNIQPVCKNGKYVGINLSAAIFSSDTTIAGGRKNLLYFVSSDYISILYNDILTKIDSISCGERTLPISVGLLVDRSGSMVQTISDQDLTQRMSASKKAISGFIDNLHSDDSSFVMSFSTDIRIDKDWTNNKTELKSAVNSLQGDSKTAFYGALLTALQKVAVSNNPRRALVILSDGCNNVPPDWSDSILTSVQKINIPVYIIALGLSDDPCDIDGREKMGLIAQASRGRVYDVYNSGKLDSVYMQLSRDISEDECCNIYFKIEPCSTKTERTVTLIYIPNKMEYYSKSITYTCDTCSATTDVDIDDGENKKDLITYPNPFTNISSIKFFLESDCSVNFKLYSLTGEVIQNQDLGFMSKGEHIFLLNNQNIVSGTYLAIVTTNKGKIYRSIVTICQ